MGLARRVALIPRSLFRSAGAVTSSFVIFPLLRPCLRLLLHSFSVIFMRFALTKVPLCTFVCSLLDIFIYTLLSTVILGLCISVVYLPTCWTVGVQDLVMGFFSMALAWFLETSVSQVIMHAPGVALDTLRDLDVVTHGYEYFTAPLLSNDRFNVTDAKEVSCPVHHVGCIHFVGSTLDACAWDRLIVI